MRRTLVQARHIEAAEPALAERARSPGVGAGSTIGGNVWLTHSVPPGSNVSQAQSRNT